MNERKPMDDYISRQTVLRCIKESRDGIDWGQSEDGDAFLHYSAALYRTVASKECVHAADVVPVVRCEDCKHLVEARGGLFCVSGYPARIMKPDDYCSYGERKE